MISTLDSSSIGREPSAIGGIGCSSVLFSSLIEEALLRRSADWISKRFSAIIICKLADVVVELFESKSYRNY
jgi:hypothetical protein